MKNLKFCCFVFVISVFSGVCEADTREGLLVNLGAGVSMTEITSDSEKEIKDNRSSGGAFSARIGGCLGEHILFYWAMRESACFFYETDNDTYDHAGILWRSLGILVFFSHSPSSFYVTGAYGTGNIEGSGTGSNAVVGEGVSWLFGVGQILLELSIVCCKRL